jgi:LPS-assembly lipoprotein
MTKKLQPAALVFFLLLAGCGWHLRGTYELPPAMALTYVDTDAKTGELTRHLHRTLRAADITVVSQPVENAARLRVRSGSGRRVISIGPDGKALEYEIFATATFSVTTPDASFELAQQEISLRRDLLFDPLDVLAANKEQEQLRLDMEKQAANLIIDRIAAAYARAKSSGPRTLPAP